MESGRGLPLPASVWYSDLSGKLVSRGLALALILFGATALYAQDQPSAASASPAITTDRPAITDSSTVVPSGGLLFENGFTETANQGQRSFDFPETLARFGLTAKTELRFTPPDYFQNFDAGRGLGSWWGDLSLGVKQQLFATSRFDAAFLRDRVYWHPCTST
jgi:hypothetical protein